MNVLIVMGTAAAALTAFGWIVAYLASDRAPKGGR